MHMLILILREIWQKYPEQGIDQCTVWGWWAPPSSKGCMKVQRLIPGSPGLQERGDGEELPTSGASQQEGPGRERGVRNTATYVKTP